MTERNIYEQIARRTGGDIYIGVVGPVRTGKSTFIGRFLEALVLPKIDAEGERERTRDAMPQSAAGRTVMTTEPKFVPEDAVGIRVGGTDLSVKLVDCVGYLVDGALGAEEEGVPREVMTPWSEKPMPFAKAAEVGTGKVIREHATVAVLVTADGSFGEIPREAFVPAEERVAKELTELGKPFAILLNSKNPADPAAQTLAREMEDKYGVPVALVNATELNGEDVEAILGLILSQFPVRSMRFVLPDYLDLLPKEHEKRRKIKENITTFCSSVRKFGDVEHVLPTFAGIVPVSADAGAGTEVFEIPATREDFFDVASDLSGEKMTSERDLLVYTKELAETKRKYDRVAAALADVEEKGYGIVMPAPEEMELDEPTVVRSAGGYGIHIGARAETIHMIKTNLSTDFSPVVGTEEQSEEVVKMMLADYEEDPKKVFSTKMFGRTVSDMVSDGMQAKLRNIPDASREKLGETIGKIMDEGANGLICILL